jgi:hypothetical protein
MRAVFVLATVVIALLLGIVAAGWESRLLVGALIVGYVPTVIGMSNLIERITGRELWDFGAPYPYRRMREGTAHAAPKPGQNLAEAHRDTDASSSLPLAA